MHKSNTAVNDIVARSVVRCGVPEGVRTERIIHSLDGIERVVEPATVMEIGRRLWEKAQLAFLTTKVDYLLGFDAGGIIPTLAVSIASSLPYKLAWKLNLDLPGKVSFTEPGAVRSQIYVYGLTAGLRVLLVDDEISSGLTAESAIAALRCEGVDVAGVLTLVEDRRLNARDALARAGVPLVALYEYK